jgi:hypothetical protein
MTTSNNFSVLSTNSSTSSCVASIEFLVKKTFRANYMAFNLASPNPKDATA